MGCDKMWTYFLVGLLFYPSGIATLACMQAGRSWLGHAVQWFFVVGGWDDKAQSGRARRLREQNGWVGLGERKYGQSAGKTRSVSPNDVTPSPPKSRPRGARGCGLDQPTYPQKNKFRSSRILPEAQFKQLSAVQCALDMFLVCSRDMFYAICIAIRVAQLP